MPTTTARKSRPIPVVNYTICPNCGHRMPDDSLGCPPNFCPSCGMRTGATLPDDEDFGDVPGLDFDQMQNLEDLQVAEYE